MLPRPIFRPKWEWPGIHGTTEKRFSALARDCTMKTLPSMTFFSTACPAAHRVVLWRYGLLWLNQFGYLSRRHQRIHSDGIPFTGPAGTAICGSPFSQTINGVTVATAISDLQTAYQAATLAAGPAAIPGLCPTWAGLWAIPRAHWHRTTSLPGPSSGMRDSNIRSRAVRCCLLTMSTIWDPLLARD